MDVKDLRSIAVHLTNIGEVVESLTALGGALTDAERQALTTARAVLDFSQVIVDSSDATPLVSAIMGALTALPFAALARLVVTWRQVIIRADEIGVTIGPLGDGVTFTGEG